MVPLPSLPRRTVPRRGVGDALRIRAVVPLLPRNAPPGDPRRGRRGRPGPFRPYRARLPGGGRDSAEGPPQDPVGGGPAARFAGEGMFPIRHPRAGRDPTPPGVARLHPLSARRRRRGALPGILLPTATAPDLRRTVRAPMGAASPAERGRSGRRRFRSHGTARSSTRSSGGFRST